LTGLDPRGIRTMKELIREHAEARAALIVSSHLLSLLEDLATTVLIVRRGRVVLHSALAELRVQLMSGERHETLEELFFRLTEAPDLSVVSGQSSVARTGDAPLDNGQRTIK
jgi:ABC-2 type transport system ATP-binding protein